MCFMRTGGLFMLRKENSQNLPIISFVVCRACDNNTIVKIEEEVEWIFGDQSGLSGVWLWEAYF